jgi:phosphomethylpyrimidine synthase
MGTQISSARRGIVTDEMKQIAKEEDVALDSLVHGIARGSIIIPKNI